MILLMHLSDLHIEDHPIAIGSTSPRSLGRAPYPWPSKRGHDERVANDLSIFFQQLSKSHENIKILVSGDLTRVGGGLDFGCCHRFLHASWNIKKPIIKAGLKSNCNILYTVPGNHDFWNTIILNPYLNRQILPPNFWGLPWIAKFRLNGLEIHLLGIDSCSGLSSLSFHQLIAFGAIHDDQLSVGVELFEDALKDSGHDNIDVIVRVVMIHHSIKRLEKSSRKKFISWLINNDVSIVLTGHDHNPHIPGNKQSPPYELCCGTTLQAGTSTKLPAKVPNHFFMHSIKNDGTSSSQVHWHTKEWWHNGVNWKGNVNPVWAASIPGIQP
jgi:predicted phosphodiesterase